MTRLRPALLVLVLGCSVSLAACTGLVTDRPDDDAPGTSSDGRCTSGIEPGSALLRRLTNGEYERALNDLLEDDRAIADEFVLPTDATVHGFDNNASVLTLSSLHVQRYSEVTSALVADLLADGARRAAVLGCGIAGDADGACLGALVRRFGRRAYRRPLGDAEIASLVALADLAAGDADPYAGVALVLQAILLSPDFLLRVELGEPEASRPGLRRFTGFETAARLSFLLRGSGPSDALLDVAAAGELDTAEGVETAARALLAAGEAKDALRLFHQQWLRMPRLAEAERDPEAFPAWSDSLRDSMKEETTRFLDGLVWGDESFLEAFTARTTHVNAEASRQLYGVTLPDGEWAQVDLGSSSERAGILTQGSLLTMTAIPGGATPVRRGAYIREFILCDPLPPPPPDVPAFPEAMAGMSERQRLAQHREDPACAGCHTKLDPVGFGLERYDEIGALREIDSAGLPLTGEGYVEGLDYPEFTGAVELGARLRDAPEVSACVATQLVRFALHREITEDDDCTIRDLQASFVESGERFRELVVALVRSDAFRYRREDEGGSP